MQVLIAFPNVEVGAEIYIKDVEKFKSIFDGYFSTGMLLNSPLQSFSSKFISKIPLYIKVNDPENVQDIATGKSNFIHELDISLKKPVYRNFIGKSENGGIINEEKLIVVSLSSEKNWNTLSDRIVPHYEKVLSKKLPTIFEEIAKQAAKFHPNIDALSFNISNDWFDLSRSFKYNGDNTELLTKFVIKRIIISNEFLKTEEFQSLKNYYLNAFSNAFLILKQQNSKYKDRK